MAIKADELVWNIYPKHPSVSKVLSKELSVSPVIAQLLLNRNIRSLSEAHSFLNPETFTHSHRFPDTSYETFYTLVSDAISEENKRIFICGDYDVDGMTSTSIMTQILRQQGAELAYYIPHRFSEGYGLNMGMMDTAIQQKAGLVIALDCGIKDVNEIAYLKKQSDANVIILDHHTMPKQLPEADLIINPKTLDTSHPYYLLYCWIGFSFNVRLH